MPKNHKFNEYNLYTTSSDDLPELRKLHSLTHKNMNSSLKIKPKKLIFDKSKLIPSKYYESIFIDLCKSVSSKKNIRLEAKTLKFVEKLFQEKINPEITKQLDKYILYNSKPKYIKRYRRIADCFYFSLGIVINKKSEFVVKKGGYGNSMHVEKKYFGHVVKKKLVIEEYLEILKIINIKKRQFVNNQKAIEYLNKNNIEWKKGDDVLDIVRKHKNKPISTFSNDISEEWRTLTH